MVISGGGGKRRLAKGKDMKQETNDQYVSLKPYEKEIFSSNNAGLFHNVTTPNHTYTNLHDPSDEKS